MSLAGLLPLALLVVVFWFLILRPARKRQRDAATTQGSLAVGARVMLSSGIFGTIVDVEDQTVEVSIAPGADVTVLRQAVARVIPEEDDYEGDDTYDPDDAYDSDDAPSDDSTTPTEDGN